MDDTSAGYYSSARKEIEPLLPPKIGALLEIGCGSGATLQWIKSIREVQFARGVELVAEVAKKAEAQFDEVHCQNIELTPLQADRKFDVILALDVLEHLVDPWEAVRKLSQLLQPGGVFLASIPNVAHWNVVMPLLRGAWNYQKDGLLDRTHLRFFTEATAIALFRDCELEVTRVEYVKIYPGRTPSQRWHFRKYIKRFVPEHLTNYQFLIRAEKAGRIAV